jgi:glycerophosphoryl diester phosphodiesterase
VPIAFNLQGHRGARGLRPENTLPSFEAALDAGVSSIETDVHLSRDGVAVLHHDAIVAGPTGPLLSSLTLAELRRYRADRNPEPQRFPDQSPVITPLAALFAERHGRQPYGIPTLEELLHFTADYAGELGERAGKSERQRQRARIVQFDLELKRLPFHPETINDGFEGTRPGLLEERIVEAVQKAGVSQRTTVRSFDHRCVRLLRRMEPRLTGAVLVAETVAVAANELVERAEARIYCPIYLFLDAAVVKQVQAAGARVLPWTVNHPEHWQRLLDWGVDGLTTDVPDQLASFLRERGIAF